MILIFLFFLGSFKFYLEGGVEVRDKDGKSERKKYISVAALLPDGQS